MLASFTWSWIHYSDIKTRAENKSWTPRLSRHSLFKCLQKPHCWPWAPGFIQEERLPTLGPGSEPCADSEPRICTASQPHPSPCWVGSAAGRAPVTSVAFLFFLLACFNKKLLIFHFTFHSFLCKKWPFVWNGQTELLLCHVFSVYWQSVGKSACNTFGGVSNESDANFDFKKLAVSHEK